MSNSVNGQIIDSIRRYPDLFHSRTEVLHHMFVVLGCGWHWERGQLVCERNDHEPYRLTDLQARVIAGRSTRIEHPYPWSHWCNLGQTPLSPRDDWKAAAEEITLALVAQGYDFKGQLEGYTTPTAKGG